MDDSNFQVPPAGDMFARVKRFLTGFPWSYLAHSQQNFLAMIQIVSVTGTPHSRHSSSSSARVRSKSRTGTSTSSSGAKARSRR